MWRNITKGLRHSLKIDCCLQNETQVLRRRSASCRKLCISELIPSALQSLKLCTQKLEYDQKYKQENYEKRSRTRPVAEHTFLEAFGWSGALVFAWVISKQWWFKYKWAHDTDIPCLSPHTLTASCPIFDKNFVRLLNLTVKTQPPVAYVLPQLKPNSAQDIPKLTESTPLGSQDDDLDEFEAAAVKLLEVHEKTVGEALNRRGIACLSKATGTEAITFFKRAAEFKYPPASFNIGQCCELGIGTEQDFKKAAEWYKVASEQGHATAKYNLGVFYAHGWGGLVADIAIATKLFVEAAKLGQPDAIAALDKESRCKQTDCVPKIQPDICKNYSNIPQLDKSEWNILLKNFIFASSGDDAIKRTIDIIQSTVK